MHSKYRASLREKQDIALPRPAVIFTIYSDIQRMLMGLSILSKLGTSQAHFPTLLLVFDSSHLEAGGAILI